jgi:bifunctional ADP-heptose synthase (sugar kinase/adenylyltransferase)
MTQLLTDASLARILDRIPSLTIGVLGDLFLDRYLDIDAALTEPSLETGLDAYQVVRVRPSPGAAGTVINNLVALGVQSVRALSVIGDDGEGYELRRALDDLGTVDRRAVFFGPERRTPTYMKPMLKETGCPARELNRLDIKNHSPLSPHCEEAILRALEEAWAEVDALVVLDQVGLEGNGVITPRVVERLGDFGDSRPNKVILVDAREAIGRFRSVWLKPNQGECLRAVPSGPRTAEACAHELACGTGRPVFCTCGERGIWLVDPRPEGDGEGLVAAYPVAGPIDIVGAGDSASAGIACALAAGLRPKEAGAFGNLVASITIQQIGTTGTARPDQIRNWWGELRALPSAKK